jgi:O-antigen ligase
MSRFPPDIGSGAHHGHAVAFAALVAPVVAVVAPLGLAFVLGISAVVVLGLRRARTGTWLSRPNQVTVVVGVLIAWMVASYFWSIDANAFTDKIPRLVAILVAGVVFVDGSYDLDLDAKRWVRRMLIIGIAVGLTLLLVDRISDGGLRRLMSENFSDRNLTIVFFNRTVTVLALLIWPAALAIWRRRPILAVAAWTGSIAVIVLFESNAAIAGLLGGVVACALVFWRPRRAAAAIGVALAVLVMVSPLIPSWLPDRDTLRENREIISNSGFHRLLIWKFVGEKIAERPVLGWGFNTSRSIPGAGRDLDRKIGAPALPLHPHNASLQIWLELGLPGAALGAVLIGGIMIRIGRMAAARIDKAASAALVLGIATIGNLSYGAWQSWWLAAIWLSAGFMAVAIERTGEETDRAR